MHKGNINHWSNIENTEGLLYFAQRLNETLFDYTLDTFKPRVLNTSILTYEAITIISDVKNNKIDGKNINYVIDELNWSFQNDIIAKRILGNEKDIFFPLVDSGKKDDLKLKIELLAKKFSAKKYFDNTKIIIKESVLNNQKRNIDIGIDSFVSTLKAAGFSQGFLFHKTHEYFFNPNNPIDNLEQIHEFLDQFELKTHKYECIFIVSKDFEEIEKTYKKFKILKIEPEDINEIDADCNSFIQTKNSDEIFIICKDINAFDINGSRKNAYHLLNKLRDYLAFYHHKEKLKISKNCISKANHDTNWKFVKEPNSPMKKGSDKKKEKAAIQLEKFLKEADFSPVSFRKIDRAIDLHGLSLESSNFENQILNLWISLEMLIPQNSESSKIQQITDILIPFLTISYFQQIIKYLAKGMTKWNYHRSRYYLSKVTDDYGNNIIEKFTAFICLDDFAEERNNLYSELNNFPLLRNRLFTFSEILSSPKKIIRYIEKHEKKLLWQLRRIYRSRNMIIHDGKKIGYLEQLIENGHNYFDTFLNTIIMLNLNKGQINTLEQGIKIILLLNNQNKATLSKNKDSEINKENYKDIILGNLRHYSQQWL